MANDRPSLGGRSPLYGKAPLYDPSVSPTNPPGSSVATLGMPSIDFGASIGEAAGKFGQQAVATADVWAKAQDKTRSAQALTQFMTELDDAEMRHARDPDFLTAPERFGEELKAAKDKALSGTLSEDARVDLENRVTRYGLTAAGNVRKAALLRETDANRASLDTQEVSLLRRHNTASSPAERVAAHDEFEASVTSMEESGWIGLQDGVKRRLRFARAIDDNDAEVRVKEDPVNAQIDLADPEKFPTFGRRERAQFTKLAQDTIEAREENARNTPERQAFEKLATGQLDETWLDTNAPALSDARRKVLKGAVTAPPSGNDPAANWELISAVQADPSRAMVAIAEARAQGRIDEPRMRGLLAHNIAVAQMLEARPDVAAPRAALIARLAPTAKQDPEEAASQLAAVPEFDAWLQSNPRASETDIAAQADTIARKHKASAAWRERLKLPMPPFAGTSKREEFDGDTLATSASRMRIAYQKKMITEQDLLAGVDVLQRWQDLFGREGSLAEKKK